MSTYSTINTHTSGGVEQGHQDPIIFVCFSSSEYFGVKLFNPKRTSLLTSACLLLSLPMNAGCANYCMQGSADTCIHLGSGVAVLCLVSSEFKVYRLMISVHNFCNGY